MLIKELMTRKVESVRPDLSLTDCARIMRERNVGALPVLENGKLLGMITDRDICCRAVANGFDPTKTTVRQVMSAEVSWCYDDQDCAEAARLMGQKHIRRLAVLDRGKAMAGFLSVDDLARWSHDLAGQVLEAARPVH